MGLFSIFSTQSRFEKAASKYHPAVETVNAMHDRMQALTDIELQQCVTQYKGKGLDELQQEAPQIFAAVREASQRVLKMRHFDVQVLGGFALLDGTIAEMKTGEGKTLVATLPLVLHGLAGRGAHLVTVNDYLSKRDAEWMKPLYEFFDLTVGFVAAGQTPDEKRAAYGADITYGTNNEFGFDYLRDNMAQRPESMVQRGLAFAIIDEVDSILIDEARTPLIISAPDADSTELYARFARLVPTLQEDKDYNTDEKRKAATLTDQGVTTVEQMLGVENIYADKGIRFVHHLEQALRAHTLYQKDKDYVVKDGQVIIVDEFTGRLMEGRRYAEGLHQAIEAKEGVRVQQESRTLATITFQNFFRLYDQLAGMTGTAATSAEEFEKVYNLDVLVIPTNQELIRIDKSDRIYASEKIKYAATVAEISERHKKGQPVLVGTIAIEKSEHLSGLLAREGIPHEVLNAKHHKREAEIIAKAGQRGSVTISTNMAGRGTDIKLGEGVHELGGLFVLGTERHEARRIDNQLRGRSGRQGDPGETQFFVSLEDDVMRIFGGDKIRNIMERFNFPEDEPIENKLVTRAINGAQDRVEGYYFDMRKQVLAYDDVLNKQREAIYTLRRGVLADRTWREAGHADTPIMQKISELTAEHIEKIVEIHTGEREESQWDIGEIAEAATALTGSDPMALTSKWRSLVDDQGDPDRARGRLQQAVLHHVQGFLDDRRKKLGEDSIESLSQAAILRAIDTHWMEHLDTMDYLRTGIGLRGYGQRDPLVEYQREGYRLFQNLLATIYSSSLEVIFRAEPAYATPDHNETVASDKIRVIHGGEAGSALHELATTRKASDVSEAAEQSESGNSKPIVNARKGVGRNDPCWCGSGKKYKKCHGAS